MRALSLTFLSLLAISMLASPVLAIPALQTYINAPDAEYDASTDTWVTHSGSFELWVITAKTGTKPLYDLNLVFALSPDQSPVAGALTIDGTSIDDFLYGTPPSWGGSEGDYPPHGVYPTYFAEFSIASFLSDNSETVHNMEPGQYGDVAPGKVFKYQIETSYDWLHFDSYGFFRESDGQFTFSPNSHDAEKNPPTVPEPGTLLLLGLGLSGMAIARKRSK